jgi:hypothetical protein
VSWFKVILPWLESLTNLEVLNHFYKLKSFMLKGVEGGQGRTHDKPKNGWKVNCLRPGKRELKLWPSLSDLHEIVYNSDKKLVKCDP